jgi:hypothetical protein
MGDKARAIRVPGNLLEVWHHSSLFFFKIRIEFLHASGTYSMREIHPDIVIEVVFNATPVLLIISNLLNNARKSG